MNQDTHEIDITLVWLNENFYNGQFEIDSYNPDGKAKRYKLAYNYGKSTEVNVPAHFRFFGAKAFNLALDFAEQMLVIHTKQQKELERHNQEITSNRIQDYKDENDKLRKRNEQLEAQVKVANKRYLRCLNDKESTDE